MRRVRAGVHEAPQHHTPPSEGIHPEDFRITDTEMARQFDPVAMAEQKNLHREEDFQGQASNERMTETVESQQGSVDNLPVDLFLTSMNTLKVGNDSLGEKIDRLAELLSGLLDDAYKSRVFEEQLYPVSTAVEIPVDYKERKYLYILATGALTLTGNDGTSVALVAGWNNFSMGRGVKYTAAAVSASTPVFLRVRATDTKIL